MVEKSRKLYLFAKKSIALSLIAILVLSFVQVPQAHASLIYGASVALNNDFPTNISHIQLTSSGDNVYTIWQDDGQAINEIFFSSSANNGTSFGSQLDLSNNLAADSTVPEIAATGSSVYVVWQETDLSGDEIFFQSSNDNGTTFNGGTPGSPGAALNLSNNPSSSITPSIAASGSDVYVVWQDGFNILFTRSTDNGHTFSAPSTLSLTPLTQATSPKIIASGNNVYVIWHDDNDVYFDKSNNSGAIFAGAANISGTGTAQLTPAQLAASASNVYVVWQDTSPGNNEILFKSSNDTGTIFTAATNLSHNTGLSEFPQIAASGNNVYIAWQDDLGTISTFDVLFERSSNNGSSFNGGTLGNPGVPVNLSDNTGSSEFPHVSATGSNLFVVWQDNTFGTYQTAIVSSQDDGNTVSGLKNLSMNTGPSTAPQVEANGDNVYVAWNDNTPGYPNVFFSKGTASSLDIAFDKSQYAIHGTATITVTSPASNLNVTAIDSVYPVTITTTSDPTGISVTLNETGINTGIFKGNITFTSGISSGTVLHAAPSDSISASFSGQMGSALIFPRTVSFDFPGGYDTGDTVVVTVTDQNSVVNASKRESLLTHITSLANPSGIDLNLTETAAGSGVFTNDKLQFMGGNYLFPIDSDVTVTFEDDNLVGSAILNAHSTSDPGGIASNASETSTPHVFSVKLKLITTSSNATTNSLHVSTGDFVWFAHASAQNRANGMITPNGNASNGIIRVNTGVAVPADVVTATYLGASGSVPVNDAYAPGGSGGGIVRPGLILDVVASISHGGSNSIPPIFDLSAFTLTQGYLPDNIKTELLNTDPTKPLVPKYDNAFDYPLVIDGAGYLVKYSNNLNTITEKTGVPAEIKLSFPVTNMEHLALYLNQGNSHDIPGSDTYVIYDKGQPLQKVDPHGYFDKINFDMTAQGDKAKIDYKITFAKPMPKSDIIFRTWNDMHASADLVLLDAIQVDEGPKSTLASEVSSSVTVQTPLSQSHQTSDSDILSAVKDWAGYSSHPITDAQLLSQIGMSGQSIPHWTAKAAKYAVDGDITPQELATVLQYLASNGVIK